MDDDGSKKAFAFLKELEPYLAPEYVETRFDTANELLIDDEVYLVSNWTYGFKVVVKDAGKKEIKVYSGWNGPESEVHVLGGDVLSIPKDSPHPNQAIKLIELLLSKKIQKILASRLCWPPVRQDVYDEIPDELNPYFQVVNDALSTAVIRSTMPQWTLVERMLDHTFGELIRKGNAIALLEKYSEILKRTPSQYIVYDVNARETLEEIAISHNTTVDILAEANGIITGTSIGPRQMQILLIPQY